MHWRGTSLSIRALPVSGFHSTPGIGVSVSGIERNELAMAIVEGLHPELSITVRVSVRDRHPYAFIRDRRIGEVSIRRSIRYDRFNQQYVCVEEAGVPVSFIDLESCLDSFLQLYKTELPTSMLDSTDTLYSFKTRASIRINTFAKPLAFLSYLYPATVWESDWFESNDGVFWAMQE
jgi:hypothetical protein